MPDSVAYTCIPSSDRLAPFAQLKRWSRVLGMGIILPYTLAPVLPLGPGTFSASRSPSLTRRQVPRSFHSIRPSSVNVPIFSGSVSNRNLSIDEYRNCQFIFGNIDVKAGIFLFAGPFICALYWGLLGCGRRVHLGFHLLLHLKDLATLSRSNGAHFNQYFIDGHTHLRFFTDACLDHSSFINCFLIEGIHLNRYNVKSVCFFTSYKHRFYDSGLWIEGSCHQVVGQKLEHE